MSENLLPAGWVRSTAQGVGDGDRAGREVDAHAPGVLEREVGPEGPSRERVGDDLLDEPAVDVQHRPRHGLCVRLADDGASLAGDPLEAQVFGGYTDLLLGELVDRRRVGVEDALSLAVRASEVAAPDTSG